MTTAVMSLSLWPQIGLRRNVVLAIVGTIIVTVSAQVNVPLSPVPITLQSLAVLMIGAAYGSQLGAATLTLYALEGAVGLPVFAEFRSGVLLPSFGYVLGFMAAAYLVGYLAERGWDRSIFKMFVAMLLGAALLYVPGLIWLSVFIGIGKAIQYGFMPFVMGDVIKAAVASLSFPAAWVLLGR